MRTTVLHHEDLKWMYKREKQNKTKTSLVILNNMQGLKLFVCKHLSAKESKIFKKGELRHLVYT